jgi:glycerate kinase
MEVIMKIVIAPDSFKGTFTAGEAADIIERGVKKVFASSEIVKVPMADGGEGTVCALVEATGGKVIKLQVMGPLLEKVEAFYGILGDSETAVIESAAASGILLVKTEDLNPMKATTYGTGELIKDALDRGCRRFIIGLGGSATNDGGAGMVAALGARLMGEDGEEIELGGGNLDKLCCIDCSKLDKRLADCLIVAACDVNNPLCGESGASYVFAPQKGADAQMVDTLDHCLAHFASIVKRDVGVDITDIPGAGAAGGLGGGLVAFLGANLEKGVDIVVRAAELEARLKDADLVITGEGSMDHQTTFGKTPLGVARTARKMGIHVIAIAGSIERGCKSLYDSGFDCIIPTVECPTTLHDAMKNGSILLECAAERAMRAVKIGIDIHNS